MNNITLMRLARIMRSAGLTVDAITPEDDSVDGAEASIIVWRHFFEIRYTVLMWTGSYPFAEAKEVGDFRTAEDAVRYVVWLLKRESFYYERDEAMVHWPEDLPSEGV